MQPKKTLILTIILVQIGFAQADDSYQLPVERLEPGRITPQNSSPAPTLRDTDDLYQPTNVTSSQNRLTEEQIRAEYEQQFASTPVDTKPDFLKQIESQFKPKPEFTMKPGDNIVFPVSMGLMNSIKTDFNSLAVKTSDEEAVLEVEDGFLYATLKNNNPVGLILYEDGVLESQISITLVPISAPPVMANIKIERPDSMKEKATQYQQEIVKQEAIAQAQEEKRNFQSEHQKRIVNLLTPVAKGDYPRGFSMTNDIPLHHVTPCKMTVKHQAMQRLTGGREVIDVVLVENDSDRIYQVREEMCLDNDTVAVALFERSYLKPGQKMELYIVRDRYYKEKQERTQRRPRLTGE